MQASLRKCNTSKYTDYTVQNVSVSGKAAIQITALRGLLQIVIHCILGLTWE